MCAEICPPGVVVADRIWIGAAALAPNNVVGGIDFSIVIIIAGKSLDHVKKLNVAADVWIDQCPIRSRYAWVEGVVGYAVNCHVRLLNFDVRRAAGRIAIGYVIVSSPPKRTDVP